MRVIYIDPDKQTITEQEIEAAFEEYQRLVGGYVAPIWVVPAYLDDHVGLVEEEGIRKKLRIWHFGPVHIWGPMIILGHHDKPATVSIEQVKPFVTF